MNESRIYPLILPTEARWSWILTALQFGIRFLPGLITSVGGRSFDFFLKNCRGSVYLKKFRLTEAVGSGYLKGIENQRTVGSVGLPKEPPVLSFFDFLICFPGLISGVRVSRSGNY